MYKYLFYFLLSLTSVSFVACSKDDTKIIDSSKPENFSKQRSGTFVAQNSTPTAGTAEIGTDGAGAQWVHLGSDFKTELGTGTATVYLSTSMAYVADPAAGNPNLKLVGVIGGNGEQFYKVASPAGANFTHVIIWCGSANIPFGYSKVQ